VTPTWLEERTMPDHPGDSIAHRILIVEDETMLAEGLAQRLRDLGYEIVATVSSAEEAVRKTEDSEIDLILIGIRLTGKTDGIEAADDVRSRLDVPVVYLMKFEEEDVADQAEKTEPYGYLGKPAGRLELRNTIETALYKHQADKRVRKSEQKYKNLFHGSNDAICIHDLKGTIIEANRRFQELFGYLEEELLALSVIHLSPKEVRPTSKQHLENIARDEHLCFEIEFVRKDGEVFAAEVSSSLCEISGRKMVQGIVRDITERKNAEQALIQADKEWENTFDTVPDLIMILDTDYKIVRANKAMAAGLGVTPVETIGMTCYEAVHGLKSPVPTCPHALLLADGKKHTAEVTENRLNGVFEVSVAPLYDEHGQLTGSVHVAHDITDRKKAERLVEARVRQQAAVAALGQSALAGRELSCLMTEAAEKVAHALDVEYCTILELLPGGNELVLRAGVGWKEGLVDHAIVEAGEDSQAGYTLLAKEPVVVEDFLSEKRFSEPPVLHQHDIRSGVSVVIQGRDRPFGILGAHTREVRTFTQDDVSFFQAVAQVLALGIDRSRTEEALRESETRFRDLAELLPQFVFEIDSNSVFTFANRAGLETSGYTLDDISRGIRVLDVVVPEDRERVASTMAKALAGEGVTEFDGTFLRKDGTTFPFVAYFSLIKEHDIITGARGVGVDITDRVEAEEALRRSQDRLRKVMDHSPMPIAVTDTNGKMEYVNQKFVLSFGYTLEDIPTLEQWLSLAYPDKKTAELVRSQWVEATRRARQTGKEAKPAEREVACKDGTIRVVDFRKTVIDEQVIHTLHDITEIKRAETALRESERRYRQLVENANDFIYQTDTKGRLTFVNPAVLKVTGYSEADVKGKHYCPLRGMGEKPSPLGEDFSRLAVS
jgi:PAS domain S-box-containing protein